MNKVIVTSGKRKRAIARATMKPGKGRVRINHTPIEIIEPVLYRMKMLEPLMLGGDLTAFDIEVNVMGGGYNSQAEAVRLALGRALVQNNKKLEKVFLNYDRTLLVADVRRHESSKPGRNGQARAKMQKSYR